MNKHFSFATLWAIPAMASSAIMFISGLIMMKMNASVYFQWLVSSLFQSPLYLTIIFDSTGFIFGATVLFISANVLLFTSTYMKDDMFMKRFSSLIILFISSMLLLIFLPNMITLMIGWDGLGIISFLLVIYYANPKSLSAGMLTVLTNRLGDAFMLTALATMISHHWLAPHLWPAPCSTSLLLLTLAAFTKSAQMPFSSWLPAAMAAPTPISALVHSSTLVTAGVFLLIRLHPFMLMNPLFNKLTLVAGSATMLMAGMSACFETDMKKIIALSTLSQLGIMIFTLGLNLPQLTFFHLITHALFKALLFVCAGQIIHFNSHNQDLRTSSMAVMPLTTSAFMVANLTLCGTPFLSAFYSKDLILEMCLLSNMNSTLLILLLLATALTTTYTTRMIMTLLITPPQILSSNSEDSTIFMSPLYLLTLAAITSGAAINWMFIHPMSSSLVSLTYKLTPLMIILVGAYIATSGIPNSTTIKNCVYFNSSMWFLTPISSQGTLFIAAKMNTTPSLDYGWQETIGGQGASKVTMTLSKHMNNLQAPSTPTHILLCTLVFLPLLKPF